MFRITGAKKMKPKLDLNKVVDEQNDLDSSQSDLSERIGNDDR